MKLVVMLGEEEDLSATFSYVPKTAKLEWSVEGRGDDDIRAFLGPALLLSRTLNRPHLD